MSLLLLIQDERERTTKALLSTSGVFSHSSETNG